MKSLSIFALAGSVLLGGCASSGHCLGEFDYQKAYSLPQANAAGIKTPASSAALVIPPLPARIVPYGSLVDDPQNPGKVTAQCLDTPPRLPTLPAESAAPAAKPAKS